MGKKINNQYKLFIIYLIMSLCIDFLSRINGHLLFLNNLIFFNILSILEIIIFSLFYSFYINKTIIYFGLLIGVSYSCYEMYLSNPFIISFYYCYSKNIVSLLIIIYCLIRIFKNTINENLIKNNCKDIIITLFFSFEFILLLPFNFLINYDLSIAHNFWFLRFIMTLFFYISITYFIWQNGKTQKQLSDGSSFR
ncbi:hypothetical protein FHS70_000888 [Flammeovirga yaeyamensis]|nr:hypothetical protein [Flammeovirga yaeyamensis]